MTEPKVWVFDVTMRVRRRMHFGGPQNAEAATAIIKAMLGGGIAPMTLAMRDATGQPIEQIIDNDFEIVPVDA